MKLQDLFEMPQMIDDITWVSFEDPIKNKSFYDKYINSNLKNKLFDLTDNATVYSVETRKIYFCLDTELERVTYYMEYLVGDNNVLQEYVYQSLVWTDFLNHKHYLIGLPEKIFFKYLLSKYNTIVTDSEQTFKGKRFWENRIWDAFKMNLNVYFFDFKNKKLVKLDAYNKLEAFQKEYNIWGTEDHHLGKRMVISTENLK